MNNEVQQEEETREVTVLLCEAYLELEYLMREKGETPPPRPPVIERTMFEHAADLKDFVPFSNDEDEF